MSLFTREELVQVKAPASLLPKCGDCGLHKNCLKPYMPPSGRGMQRVMLIGAYPGQDEDQSGKQFSGPSGLYLESVLKASGFHMRDDCILHNALSCRPIGKPHDQTVSHCRPNVTKAIKDHDPNVIILMGAEAIESVLSTMWKEDIGGMGLWVGTAIPGHKPNAWICPTYNPAAVLRSADDPVRRLMFEEHVATALTLANSKPWPDGPPNWAACVEIIMGDEDAASRIRQIRGGTIAFDFENSPLKPDSPTRFLRCASICWNGEETIAFPWGPQVYKAFRDLMGDPDVAKIAHNIKHEDRWCNILGMPVYGWFQDTMLMAHAIDSRTGITSLKFQAFATLGQSDYAAHITPFFESKGGNTHNRIKQLDLPSLLRYNGLDSLLEYLLAVHQSNRIGRPLPT